MEIGMGRNDFQPGSNLCFEPTWSSGVDDQAAAMEVNILEKVRTTVASDSSHRNQGGLDRRA